MMFVDKLEQNQKKLNILNILMDVAAVIAAMAVAYVLRFYVFIGVNPFAGLGHQLLWTGVLSPVFVLLYGLLGLYSTFRTKTFISELGGVILCNFIGTMLYLDVFFLFRLVDLSRWMMFLFFLALNVFMGVVLYVQRLYMKRLRQKGVCRRKLIIVGSGAPARAYYRSLRDNPDYGYDVLGNIGLDRLAAELPLLGGFADIRTVFDRLRPDEAVIALDVDRAGYLKELLLSCENSGVKLLVLPFSYECLSSRPSMEAVAGFPLLDIRRVRLDDFTFSFVKRAFDVIVSLLMIIATSPIMLAAAVGTKISSPGPIIFRQARVGRHKKTFYMLKFRSMRVNETQDTGWSTKHDSRRTKFGAFMRRYSIDELPQLFNVLAGDMSLVGPRPEVPFHVEEFRDNVPLYLVRNRVRPGMTGWSQVNGLRGDTSIEERVRYDLYYIENWSMIFDLKILLMTPFRGIVNKEESLITNEQ